MDTRNLIFVIVIILIIFFGSLTIGNKTEKFSINLGKAESLFDGAIKLVSNIIDNTDCSKITNSTDCISKKQCGFCADTNKCVDGDINGPTHNSTKNMCNTWLYNKNISENKKVEKIEKTSNLLKEVALQTQNDPIQKEIIDYLDKKLDSQYSVNCSKIKNPDECVSKDYCVYCNSNNLCLNGNEYGPIFSTDCNQNWSYKQYNKLEHPTEIKPTIKKRNNIYNNCDCEKYHFNEDMCTSCKNCNYCSEYEGCYDKNYKELSAQCRLNIL